MKMEQSVPKRRHVKFRRRGITRKKEHNKYHFLYAYKQKFITMVTKAFTGKIILAKHESAKTCNAFEYQSNAVFTRHSPK
jgi:hypothetical protein